MGNRKDFEFLVEQAMQSTHLTHMRPVIAKELFHYDILFALNENDLLDNLVFQGGTSLRLCYGAGRFSEDLDFVGGKDFNAANCSAINECLETYIGQRYSLDIDVKSPSKSDTATRGDGVNVDKWQIKITTEPARKDLPKQKIKFEIANVPAYSRKPVSLKSNYNFLPDGYSDMIILTESLDEIMADKLISLVSCRKYHRHRDIWDLHWLSQNGAEINIDYMRAKIQDYFIEDYMNLLELRMNDIEDIIKDKPFLDEISRFLPADIQARTLQKPIYLDMLVDFHQSLMNKLKRALQDT